MLAIQSLKEKLNKNEIALGAMITSKEPSVCEMYGRFGFDFLWIDAEHAPYDLNDLYLHMIAASSGNVPALVRISQNDPDVVKPVIEMGADGIIFPNVQSVEDARKAAASCLYPPKGVRGFGPKRCLGYGGISEQDYLKESENLIWKVLMVEHVDCVNNLEEICQIDGIDALLIGFNDLSASVGLLTQTSHPVVVELMDRICEIGVKYKKPVGIFSSDTRAMKRWIEKGVRWFCIGADMGYMSAAGGHLKTVREELRQQRGDRNSNE